MLVSVDLYCLELKALMVNISSEQSLPDSSTDESGELMVYWLEPEEGCDVFSFLANSRSIRFFASEVRMEETCLACSQTQL